MVADAVTQGNGSVRPRLVDSFLRDNTPDTASGITQITRPSRNEMYVTVHDGLSRIHTTIHANIESGNRRISRNNKLPLSFQVSGNVCSFIDA